MTQEEIVKLIEEWQLKLKLNHWTIDIEFNAELPDDAKAQIDPISTRNYAIIRFPEDVTDDKEVELDIIHELLHLHLCRIYETVERMCSYHSREFQNIINEEVRNKVELATDAISTAISEFASTIK